MSLCPSYQNRYFISDHYNTVGLSSVKIYIHQEEDRKGVPLHQIPRSPKLFFYNLTLDQAVNGHYITIVGTSQLFVCELEVYNKVSHACPAGVYGRNCQNQCGQCLNRTPCDPDTGLCGPCDPGYIGDTCTQECQHGKFGPFCTGICRCKYNATCHHVTGACPESRCSFGWEGVNCNISLNRAFGKDVNVSRVDSDWPAENAVDGLYFNQTRDYCAKARHWLLLDLGTAYAISTVIVHGSLQVERAGIYLYTTESDRFKLPILRDTLFYSHTLVFPVMARYVKLERLYFDVICEIEVYGDCPDGTYGSLCESNCSRNCNDICDKVSGQCINGCIAGWRGDYCDQECATPSFGQNCSYTCHCMKDSHCDHVDGKCDFGICNPGWQGPSCDHECSTPTFGQNCSNTCHCVYGSHCDHVDGVCNLGLCDPGWLGPACDKECPEGTHGIDCKDNCSRNCNGNCDKVSGQCTHGCVAGWQGDKCYTECTAPSFGQNCYKTCHCINGSHCDHVDGICDLGLCEPGWLGPACDQECQDGNYGYNCEGNCSRNCNGSCDKVSGHCTHGCNAGWQGDICSNAKPDPIQTGNQAVTLYFASIMAVNVFAVVFVAVMVYIFQKRRRSMRNNGDPAPDVTEMVGVAASYRGIPGSSRAGTRPVVDRAGVNEYQDIKIYPDDNTEGVYCQIDSDYQPTEPASSGPVVEPMYINTVHR